MQGWNKRILRSFPPFGVFLGGMAGAVLGGVARRQAGRGGFQGRVGRFLGRHGQHRLQDEPLRRYDFLLRQGNVLTL